MRRRVTILGATGSIGSSAVDLLGAHRDRFEIVSLVANRNVVRIAEIARELNAEFVALADETQQQALREALSGTGIQSGAGQEAVLEAVARDADTIIAGIAGTAGVPATHAALRPGRTLALANKECLVCAGDAFMRDVRQRGVTLMPLDSEHNALHQALGDVPISDVERMTLTASGGPFRTWDVERIRAATPEQALKHPKWSMGAKISIDSATMMNKGLELIEAQHLFSIPPAQLAILVHPEAIVHGLVHFVDGSVSAGMAAPDMRVALAHCLAGGTRLRANTQRFDLARIGSLTFEAPDEERFPAIRIVRDAMAAGGVLPTVLNAANEIAVAAFLEGRIGFMQIAALVEEACARFAGKAQAPDCIESALSVDHDARRVAAALLP